MDFFDNLLIGTLILLLQVREKVNRKLESMNIILSVIRIWVVLAVRVPRYCTCPL